MNLGLLFPEWIALGFLVIMIFAEISRADVMTSEGPRMTSALPSIAMLGCLTALLSLFPLVGKEEAVFGGTLILDPLALFSKVFFLLTVFVIVFMSRGFLEGRAHRPAEFFLILWSSLFGFFFLVSANDFLVLFISLEIVTLSFYALAAYMRSELVSIEAGLKYLILGSLASAFVIYGIALLYTSAGSTSFVAIREAFTRDPQNPLMLVGILLILSGLGFKVASVPFQLWVPDVYEGAPTPVAAYLSVGSKAAGFLLLLRILFTVFIPFESQRTLLFSALAAMTLLYGNLGALVQTNIKRLFGYSSIGHAGYLLIGIAAGKEIGTGALLYYLMAYGTANLAAFFVISLVGRKLQNDKLEAYRGLAARSPWLAGILFVSLLSLAGVPPLAGFFGKFLLLLAAVESGLAWLALLGALGVAISLYYYLSVVRVMYIEKPEGGAIPLTLDSKILLGFLALAILLMGFWQAPFLSLVEGTARSLF